MPFALYQGICDGVGAGELDAHGWNPDGGDAGEQARLEGGGGFALAGAHAGWFGAHHDEPFKARELSVEGAQQARAHAADQLAVDQRAAADELAADQVAEAVRRGRRRWRAPRSGSPPPRGRDFSQVERLAHRHDGRHLAAGLGDGGAHERVDLRRRIRRGTPAPMLRPASSSCTASGYRPLANASSVAELFLQLTGLLVCLADFRVEVCDDPVLGRGDEVGVADRDTEQRRRAPARTARRRATARGSESRTSARVAGCGQPTR